MSSAVEGRVVWSGRHSDEVAGMDGWSTSHAGLARALDGARQLVLVDPLSFPWEVLRAPQRDIPVVLVAPTDVDELTLRRLLGAPLLDRLTPWDRVVADIDELTTALAVLPDGRSMARKARFNRTADLLVQQLRGSLAAVESSVRRVELWRTGEGITAHLQGRLGPGWLVGAGGDDGPAGSSPHAVVVRVATDGEEDLVLKQLRGPFHRLQPGGSMIIVADVVPEPGAPAGTGIRGLLEALQRAAGMGYVVEEFRSVQWPGEARSRGVVIEVVSLLGTGERVMAR